MRYRLAIAVVCTISLVGCVGDAQQSEQDEFFTSGSRQADQRAEQRVAKDQQLKGEAGNERGNDRSSDASQKKDKTLFARLGGEQGINAIVDDFVARVMADPRVNWERKGVSRSPLSLTVKRAAEWRADEASIARMKTHLAQFLAVATGGPPTYEGRDMKQVHDGLVITNAEFDAAIGDLKATLDKLAVPLDEQKELLSVIESTRPQVVTKR